MWGIPKGERLVRRIFQLREVDAICDHLRFFFHCKLKHEIRRKTLPVAPDLFIEALGRHTIQLSQIGVEQHFLPTNEQDASLQRFDKLDRIWRNAFHFTPRSRPLQHREAQRLARIEISLRHLPCQCAHPAYISGALGDGDGAACVQQVKGM